MNYHQEEAKGVEELIACSATKSIHDAEASRSEDDSEGDPETAIG